MSIPFEFDPMGAPVTGEAPVTYTDCNIDFDNFPEPGKGAMPLPYMMKYVWENYHSFFREGIVRHTHFIMVADVENADTHVGILGKIDTNPAREDFLCITDAPVGEVVSKKLVEMRLHSVPEGEKYIQYLVAPWGSGWSGRMSLIEQHFNSKAGLSEWRSNGVDESGVETFTWVRSISNNYLNPIQLPTKTEGVTDCPDGMMHFRFSASKYLAQPTAFGFKYTFNPNSTVCPTIQ